MPGRKSKSKRTGSNPGPFASKHTYKAKRPKAKKGPPKTGKKVRRRKLNTITI